MLSSRQRTALFILAAAPFLVRPATADWLVLRDGSKVETEGAWEERGATVVFHLKGGRLSSMRADTVDLQASRAATAAAVEAAKKAAMPQAAAAPAPKKKPVVVLTDADVGHVTAEQAAADAAAAAAPAEGTPAEGAQPAAAAAPPAEEKKENRLQVVGQHRDNQHSGGVKLMGEIVNVSQETVGDIRISATLWDSDGKLIANGDAVLGAPILSPGVRTNFMVVFPGVYSYATATFETKGFALRTQSSDSAAPQQ